MRVEGEITRRRGKQKEECSSISNLDRKEDRGGGRKAKRRNRREMRAKGGKLGKMGQDWGK